MKNGNSLALFLILESCLFFLGIYYLTPNEPADAKNEEVAVEETQLKQEEVADTKSYIEKIPLDNDFSVVFIDDVAYLLYDSGYGSSHTSSITPMYDEMGKIMTKEQYYEIKQVP